MWIDYLWKLRPRRVVEIGVWKGDFAATILRECDFIEEYFMIDPWSHLPNWDKPFNVDDRKFDSVHNEAMEKTAFAKERVRVLRGCTKEVINQIPDGSLDFAYIDGDHTLRGITLDLAFVLPKIRIGGAIGGDDFSNDPWQHSLDYEPTLVCPYAIYFAEAADLPVTALPFRQYLIEKAEGSSFRFTDETGNYSDLSLKTKVSVRRLLYLRAKSLIRRLRGK